MLTFYDLYGKLPAPYESVLTKAYKHGRVTVARNMSQAIADEIIGTNLEFKEKLKAFMKSKK